MDAESMEIFMQDQIKEIEKARKMKMEELGYDPGDEYIINWINENSEKFRKKWKKSKKRSS